MVPASLVILGSRNRHHKRKKQNQQTTLSSVLVACVAVVSVSFKPGLKETETTATRAMF